MSTTRMEKTPEVLANEAVTEVLKTQWDGEPALRLDSPPGAGKTWVVERLAVQAMELHREQCMISTQTNEQAFDLARRLAGAAMARPPGTSRRAGGFPIQQAANPSPPGPLVLPGGRAHLWIR